MQERSSTTNVYRRYLEGDLSLADAAALLRESARAGRVEVGTLELDRLPQSERERAALLLNELTTPVCQRYLAGEISAEDAARELAPFLLPNGVFALNFSLGDGNSSAPAAMTRFGELLSRLSELADGRQSENV